MSFETVINDLENTSGDSEYLIKKGKIPILFTAVHTVEQIKEDGSIKLREPYTKAIALYLNKYFDVNCMVKLNDTGIDSNNDSRDSFKADLIRFIKDSDIRLVIDLHGAKKTQEFDIEFGTLNNLSADFSTIKELEESFTENKISNIKYNDPFKGGAITKNLYGLTSADVIQVEINYRYRDYKNIQNIEKLCKSFEKFINQYNNYINE